MCSSSPAYALALEEKYCKSIQQGFLVLGKKGKSIWHKD